MKFYSNLPEHWKERLADHIKATRGEERKQLLAYDFKCNQSVNINFPDRSSATFHFAFYIAAPEINEFAVFTEHCGYHIFPFYDAEISEIIE
jgi:hypothetical protein